MQPVNSSNLGAMFAASAQNIQERAAPLGADRGRDLLEVAIAEQAIRMTANTPGVQVRSSTLRRLNILGARGLQEYTSVVTDQRVNR